MLLAMFRDLGVGLCENAVVRGASTPIASVFVNPAGERWLGYHRGRGLDLEEPPVEIPDLAGVDAVVTTRAEDGLTTRVLDQAIRLGIPRVLDAESGTPEQLDAPARRADHVVFAEHGLRSYTGISNVERALQLAQDRLPGRTVGVTLGPRGSAWKTNGGVTLVPAPKVVATDTTGCGDVFHGAYALAIAEGADPLGAARFATAVAALKAERGSSWEGMPTRSDVDQLLERGWE